MVMFNGKRLFDWFKWGVLLSGLGIGIVYLLGLIAVPHVTFATIPDINVRQQLETGVSADIGNKLLSYLGGIVPIGSGLMGIVAVLLSGGALFLLGSLLAPWVSKLVGRSPGPIGRTVLVGLSGSLLASLILTWTGILSLTFLSVFIATGLYFAILGWLSGWLFPKVGLMNVPDLM